MAGGKLLYSPDKDSEFAAHDQQRELSRRMADEYSQRIESFLSPLLGQGRVRAEVDAQNEMSTTEEAREQYKPDSQIVRSEQTSEEQVRSGAGPQGVPGALTNQHAGGRHGTGARCNCRRCCEVCCRNRRVAGKCIQAGYAQL